MDGYPYDSSQAANFVQFIGTPTTVLHVAVLDSVMNARLKERGNFDDEKPSIHSRIETYQKKTAPLARKWNAITIDGSNEIPKVLEDATEALKTDEKFGELVLECNMK